MRFADKEDFIEINEWRALRNAPILEESYYPKCGMIVPGIAAGFLVTTDTSVAFLEHFISNPKATTEERYAANKEIGFALEKVAKDLGFKRIAGITKSRSMIKNGLSSGYFAISNCELLGKEL